MPGAPAKAGLAVADLSSGMHAFGGILTSLFARERTGEGASLSVAMFDSVAEWMTYSTIYSRSTGVAHEPIGLGHPTLVPYNAFATADGTKVVVGVQNDREWKRLATALGLVDAGADTRFDTTEGRSVHRGEVEGVVGAALVTLTADVAEALLEEAGVGTARVRTSLELLDHPQLEARNRWRDTPTPVGPIPVLLPPVTFDGYEVAFGPVPELGQHTEAVLRELGLSDADLAEVLER
jgi:crotonobetainyl-CoA:carnitine CoA-transferase CaiB-like acyl-CoA transferase